MIRTEWHVYRVLFTHAYSLVSAFHKGKALGELLGNWNPRRITWRRKLVKADGQRDILNWSKVNFTIIVPRVTTIVRLLT